ILCRPGKGCLGKLSHVLRPMMMGFPIVAALNRFRSVDRRHGMSPSRPITPFPAIATWMTIEGLASAGASDIGSVVMVRLHDENIDVALRIIICGLHLKSCRADLLHPIPAEADDVVRRALVDGEGEVTDRAQGPVAAGGQHI